MDDRLPAYFAALEARHLGALTFPEVRRALTALSSVYVERRERLGRGAALDGAGKRAAFALFYGPMHFAVVEHVAAGLTLPAQGTVLDLGCGTGAAGAALALGTGARRIVGVDVSRWASEEARFTYAHFGVSAEVRAQDLGRAAVPPGAAVLLAYTVNELPEAERARLLPRLVEAARGGSTVLVVEAIAKGDKPWWPEWERAFVELGGRADEWRLRRSMPERWRLLDKAAGLRHHELTARTLHLPAAP